MAFNSQLRPAHVAGGTAGSLKFCARALLKLGRMRVRGNLVTTRSEHVPLFVFAPHIETHHDRKSVKLSNSPCYEVHLLSFLSFRFVRLTMCRHLMFSLRRSAVCCRSSGVVLSRNCATLEILFFGCSDLCHFRCIISPFRLII